MERPASEKTAHWFLPVALLAALIAGIWPALEVLGGRWLKFDESYSHGYLVLLVSLLLSIRKWRAVRPVAGCYPFWLIPFAAAAALYLAGSILLVEAFQQVVIVPLMLGVLLLIWGWRQASAFFLPVGILFFAIPVWDYLSWPLQLITVAFNQLLLSWLGIEFTVEGVFVYFPGVGAFEIAHGCSGLRYLLVGMTLATLYSELNYQRVISRIYLLCAAVLLALLANWIRVFVIIYVGYESNMTSSLIWEHDYFGWWVFAGTLVPLFFFAHRLEGKDVEQGTSGTATVVSMGSGSTSRAWLMMIPVVGFGALAWAAEWSVADEKYRGTASHNLEVLPATEWLPLFRDSVAGWQPSIRRPDRQFTGAFLERGRLGSEDGREEVFVGLYTYDWQRPGGEVVQYENHLYDSEVLIPEQTFAVPAGDGIVLGGLKLRYRMSETRVYLAYGYYVESFWESEELRAKLAQLPGIFNSRSDASLLVIGVSCQSCDGREVLERLAPSVRHRAQVHLDSLF